MLSQNDGGNVAVSTLRSNIRLNNGTKMPMVGLGCIHTDEPELTERVVETALETGYRLLDTASVYENEEEIGRAIRASSLPRHDIFLTTKVWNSDLGYERTLAAFETSLSRLGTDYIDLYMIHFPLLRLRRESWRALARLMEEGRCRAIGVSNFTIRHLEEIIAETGVVPAVNQIEINPFLNQRRLHEWCRKKDIQIQTNTPISRQKKRHRSALSEIAERYGKTTRQILIRWALQSDIAVLIRSLDPEAVAEQADVFDFQLSLRDMDKLNTLNEDLRIGWNPEHAP
jgi:diketogulonate reductase-like aldo/keto reductase